jgi:hypothetical protein
MNLLSAIHDLVSGTLPVKTTHDGPPAMLRAMGLKALTQRPAKESKRAAPFKSVRHSKRRERDAMWRASGVYSAPVAPKYMHSAARRRTATVELAVAA